RTTSWDKADPKNTGAPERTGAPGLRYREGGSGALRIELGVVALVVPLVDDIVDLLDVAFAVIFQLAEHGVPRAGLDRLHHLLRIGCAGLLDGLRPALESGIGVERIAFGIDALGLELVDDRLGGRLLARVGTEGEQGASASRAGDRGIFLVRQRIARHEHRLHALVAHLAQDQSGFLMVAADIDEIDILLLHTRDDRV